jgi:hypothetical protein
MFFTVGSTMRKAAECRFAVQVVGVEPPNRLQTSSVTRTCRLKSNQKDFVSVIFDLKRIRCSERDNSTSIPHRKAAIGRTCVTASGSHTNVTFNI